MLSETDGTDVTTYDYDLFGNLRGVVLPSGTTVDYQIDTADRRVGRSVGGVLEEQWLYQDGLNPIAQLDGAGVLEQRYVYGTMPHVPDYLVTYTEISGPSGPTTLGRDVPLRRRRAR